MGTLPVLLDLGQNMGLLMALVLAYGLLRPIESRVPPPAWALVTGVLFGGIAIVTTLVPVVVRPGITVDGSAVVVALAGPVGGPIAAVVAGILAVTDRIFIGGVGVVAGVGTLATAVACGGWWGYRLGTARSRVRVRGFALLGLAVAVGGVLWVFALPDRELAWRVLRSLTVPVLVCYPVGTAVVGTLLTTELRRRQAMDALAVSEERYRLLADRARDLMWTADLDGCYAYVSPAAQRLFGESPAARIGRPVADGMTEDSRTRWLEFFDGAREGTVDEALLRTETVLPGGESLHLETQVVAVRDERGALLALDGVSRDITARKQQEDALAYRQEFERLVAEISTAFINAEPEDLEGAVAQALKSAGTFAGDVTCNLFRIEVEAEAFTLCHRWVPDGVTPYFALGQRLAFPELPWFLPRLRAGETLYSLAGEPLPPGAEREQALLERTGLDSLVVVPILAAGRLLGYATLSTPERIETWTTECVELCRFVGELALNAVDHERTQDALRRGEASLANAQAMAHLGNWDWDFSANTVRWSAELFRIFGLSPDQPAPDLETFLRMVHADDRETIQAAMVAAVNARTGYGQECRILRPGGEERWVAVHGELVLDARGEAERMVGTVQDITERRNAEVALRESEERYRLLADQASDVIWATDPATYFTYVSPSIERLLGYGPDELVGHPLSTIMSPATSTDTAAMFAEAMAGERETARFEAPLIHKEGNQVWCEIGAVAVRDASGTLVGVQGVTRDVSERKRAEEALRESEVRFRTLVEHAPEAIVVLDAETGQFLDANANAERLFKMEREALFRVGPVDVSPPVQPDGRPSSASSAEYVRAALAGEEAVFEWVHRAADGTDIPCEIRLIAMSWNGRRVVRGSVTDISARKQAEEELRRSEENYLGVLNQAPFGVIIHRDRRILFANRVIEEMTGYAPEEITGEYFTQFVTAATHERADRQLEQLQRGEASPAQQTMELVRKDGTVLLAHLTVRTIEFRGDTARMATLFDVTERRRAEAERDRLAAAVHQAGEAILITDSAGTIEYVNPAFEAITGYSRAEAVGQTPRILKSDMQDPTLYADLWSTILRGDIWRGRFFNRRKDGSLYEVESVITPVRDDTGAIARFVQVQTDVTEQARLEAQLLQAQKMEAVGTLAGGIAHDFNNLLTGILGGIELARMQIPPNSQAHADLKEAEASAVRAAELTQQLLTVSRRREPTFGSMDVSGVIESSVRLMRRSLPETITVHTQVAPDLPAIRGDAAQLEQAILNLAINARDAMPHGGMLTLDVSTLDIHENEARRNPRARPGQFVVIEVADTGTGIPPDVLERVFDPFFTTKEQGKGTGLGLAMVYSSIEAHDGWVSIESTVGKGTTLRLCLPLISDESARTGDVAIPVAARGDETVLLVDDAEGVRQIGRTLLERLGYTVLTATDGEDAVEVFKRHADTIALVVTDLVMPRAGGHELLRVLRRIDKSLPVIAISGYASGVAPEDLLQEGFTAFVAKPFRMGDLAHTVRLVLDHELSVE